MKNATAWSVLTCLTWAASAAAQVHELPPVARGSNGSDHELIVAANTTVEVPLPANGKLNYTTVDIGPGAVVTFRANALNTPVHVLAQGDLIVAGTLVVSGHASRPTAPGAGGPGGFSGGGAGVGGMPCGAGLGPGGGRPGTDWDNNSGGGVFGTRGARGVNNASPYGSNLLVPLIGGSGGAGICESNQGRSAGGAGGGGAILLASNTKVVVSGSVVADGGNVTAFGCPFPYYYDARGESGAGSGGAIRLVAPVVEGNGTLSVQGGAWEGCGERAGAGRIRVDTIYRSAIQFTRLPSNAPFTVGSYLAAFPGTEPKLQILRVGAQALNGVSQARVVIPVGQSTGNLVTISVAATGFGATAYFRVVATPDSGQPWTSDVVSAASDGSSSDVEIVIPANVPTHVQVFSVPPPAQN